MSTATECPICGRPAHDATICRSCQRHLRTQLAQLPDLLSELDTTASHRDNVTPRCEVPTGSIDTQLPFRPKAAALAAATGAMLAAHVQDAVRLLHAAAPQSPDAGSQTAWLAAHLRDLRRHPCAIDLARDIDRHSRQILAMIDTPTVKTRFAIGPCPEAGDDQGPCPGQVWAWIPTDDTLRPVAQCNTCGRQWPAESWARLGERIKAVQARRRQIVALARDVAGRRAAA